MKNIYNGKIIESMDWMEIPETRNKRRTKWIPLIRYYTYDYSLPYIFFSITSEG